MSMSINTVHHLARARYLAVLDWSFALFSTMRLLTVQLKASGQ